MRTLASRLLDELRALRADLEALDRDLRRARELDAELAAFCGRRRSWRHRRRIARAERRLAGRA